MDDFLQTWMMMVAVFTVAVASPGPDFIMAVRNSIVGSRKAGILTAVARSKRVNGNWIQWPS